MNRKELEPIPPGEILLEEFMRPLGLSAAALARAIRVPPNRVSQILAGKRSVSADTALRLGKYFGVSPEIWLELQADYDLRVARRTTWRRVEPRIPARVA
ncbi:MAG: HigA family addiction module antidote protein [Vicinamibacteria bacterium]|jgi:addiction module HigA family antidote|nr:HigA family addiction module antidote protein [Vicinamibacteria bacterium]